MTGERVTKSRRQAVAAGRKRLSAILSAEGSELYARLKERHGSEAALIEAALKALEGSNELTDAELISTLKQRLERKNVATFATSDATGPMSQKPVKGNDVSQKIITPPKR